MIKDRELLELAAKAAGLLLGDATSPWGGYNDSTGFYSLNMDGSQVVWSWNPLNDDGDALRLAVDLGIYIQPFTKAERPATFARGVNHLDTEQVVEHGNSPYAATRRAIVRAAAEIGKAMP